jgi:hypothetical protein
MTEAMINPAAGQMEQNLQNEVEQEYRSFAEKEQAKMQQEFEAKGANDAARFKALGFVTAGEAQEMVKQVHIEYVKKYDDLLQKYDKLRQWIMQRELHGKNSGFENETPKPTSDTISRMMDTRLR